MSSVKCGNVVALLENELRQDNDSYEDMYKEFKADILCNIKEREPYLDIDYEELQNFNFVQSNEEEVMQNFQ